MTTPAVEDYLKAIYQLSEAGAAVSTSALADRLGIAPGSVTGMLKRLAEAGLVEHTPYYGARLTAEGTGNAIRTIRRHRVLERFLVDVLGYTWDRVHDEAERLEHVVTEEMIDRMAAVLGEPEADPHGAPIPAAGRAFQERHFPTLGDMGAGACAILRQVPDEDAAALRYLAELELRPGAALEVVEVAPFNGPLRVLINGQERVIGRELAYKIKVEPTAS
ncbi:MAG TPA: metal-dependent transcriptional regulator [Longimicrobiales bacterium]|nr:metal-dependent transcriptional regulator [Longimicrobiales bacterium]